jgi:hypothetical protein
MPNPWITALKKWNEGKDTWCLPKKGSKAYDEVRALMPEKKLKASAEPEKAPAPAMPEPSKSKGPRIAPKKPIRGDVEPPAPPMKIPMEPQRKAFSDSMAPKVKFVEPAKKEEPPRRKTDEEWHKEEVAEALPEIKRIVGDKPLMKLSKADLIEIVKLGHHKIGRFNLPKIYQDWYNSTGTSVYSKMTNAKKEDIVKHIQSLPSLTRNVFPKLS